MQLQHHITGTYVFLKCDDDLLGWSWLLLSYLETVLQCVLSWSWFCKRGGSSFLWQLLYLRISPCPGCAVSEHRGEYNSTQHSCYLETGSGNAQVAETNVAWVILVSKDLMAQLGRYKQRCSSSSRVLSCLWCSGSTQATVREN